MSIKRNTNLKDEFEQLYGEYITEKIIANYNINNCIKEGQIDQSSEYCIFMDNINRMATNIYLNTQKYIELRKYYEEKQGITKAISKKIQRKMIKLVIIKECQIANGTQAIYNIKNCIIDANSNFQSKGLFAYIGLKKTSKKYQKYLSKEYRYIKRGKNITRSIRKLPDQTTELDLMKENLRLHKKKSMEVFNV